MQESYKQISAENYQLRAYIISLQSRVIDAQGADALPPPPVSLNLNHPPPLFSLDPALPSTTDATQPQSAPVPAVFQQIPQQVRPAASVSPNVAAPTANMGVAPAAAPQQPIAAPAAGQKRPHEEQVNNTDGAFLQSIAQAAGTTTPAANTFVQGQPRAVPQAQMAAGQPPPQQQQQQKPAGRKSASPNAKRIKGEPQPQAEKAA